MPGRILIHIPYVSVWSNGEVIETRCSVKPDTKEVFNIEAASCAPDDGFCEREYIVIDGVESGVVEKDDRPEGYGGYWRY